MPNHASEPKTPAGPMGLPRVVSLDPAAADLLCALGAERLLVGRSHACDIRGAGVDLPVLTRPGSLPGGQQPAPLDSHGDLAGIAAIPRVLTPEGEPLAAIDESLLVSLRPDLVLVRDQRAVEAMVAASAGTSPRILPLHASSVEEVFDDLLRVGGALGTPWETAAANVMVALRERLFRAEEFVNPYEDGPVLGFLEWTEPLMCAGQWTVPLIERAGARHPWNMTTPRPNAGAALGPQRGSRLAPPSRVITPEALAQARPDALIIAPRGLSLAEARHCAERLATEPWWSDLPTVRNGRVAIIDGQRVFSRPGPALVDAFEFLVGWLHDRPALIPEGFPWERFG